MTGVDWAKIEPSEALAELMRQDREGEPDAPIGGWRGEWAVQRDEPPPLPAFLQLAEAGERWRALTDRRRPADRQHAPLGDGAYREGRTESLRRRLDEFHRRRLTALIAALVARQYKRETIRKTRTVLAQVLDHYGVDPNPVRDPRVKLPKERKPRRSIHPRHLR